MLLAQSSANAALLLIDTRLGIQISCEPAFSCIPYSNVAVTCLLCYCPQSLTSSAHCVNEIRDRDACIQRWGSTLDHPLVSRFEHWLVGLTLVAPPKRLGLSGYVFLRYLAISQLLATQGCRPDPFRLEPVCSPNSMYTLYKYCKGFLLPVDILVYYISWW